MIKTFILALCILTFFVFGHFFSFPKSYAASSSTCAEFKGEKCVAVDTAIGKISTEPQGFVRSIFSLVLGLSGGIALILIMISGYKMMSSGGNPEATKAATEQLTSAVIGLLFIIFAFVILQIVGVDILKIPGFNP